MKNAKDEITVRDLIDYYKTDYVLSELRKMIEGKKKEEYKEPLLSTTEWAEKNYNFIYNKCVDDILSLFE